jgi:hypothetical protein
MMEGREIGSGRQARNDQLQNLTSRALMYLVQQIRSTTTGLPWDFLEFAAT